MRTRYIFAFLICLAVPLLVAESTVTIQNPSEGKAIVYILRPSPLAFTIEFPVYLNGRGAEHLVGTTIAAQYLSFEVEPGDNLLYSEGESWESRLFSAKAGEILFFKQSPMQGMTRTRVSLSPMSHEEGEKTLKKLKPAKNR
jgi:hypothetical protein